MKDKTILISGANRGIGLAIAQSLSQEAECTVLLGSRDLGNIPENLPKNMIPCKLDLSTREMLENDISHIKAHHQIDILINNAGVLFEGDSLTTSLDNYDETMRVNVHGAYELIRSLLPSMIQQNFGRIVNISSGWGSFDDGLTGPFSYSLSKASLNALTMIIARELEGNVKINSMCPGWVRTRMGGMNATRSPQQGAQTALWLAQLDESGPNGKFFRDKKEIHW